MTMYNVEYEHTQRGWWHLILLVMAVAMLVGAWLAREEPPVLALCLAVAAVFILVAFMFRSLTTGDEGDRLALRYGPLPLFRKRIPYADITQVEPCRISIIDGWGVQYCPGRGWTYSLWGFGCVKLTLGRKVIRVGTDDVEKLAEFLRGKCLRSQSR